MPPPPPIHTHPTHVVRLFQACEDALTSYLWHLADMDPQLCKKEEFVHYLLAKLAKVAYRADLKYFSIPIPQLFLSSPLAMNAG